MCIRLLVLAASLFLGSMAFSQTKVAFSQFDIWRQNSLSKKMEYSKTMFDTGYLEINKNTATVVVYNARLNEKEIFEFDSFMGLEMGHYLAFGKINHEQMFNFIPEDKLVLLKTNDVLIMQFDLKGTDVVNIKNELQ